MEGKISSKLGAHHQSSSITAKINPKLLKMRPYSIFAAAALVFQTAAFQTQTMLSKNHAAARLYAEAEAKAQAAARPIEEGSHDELMYALGINLARQLGDVRPLVESPDEMTHLARG